MKLELLHHTTMMNLCPKDLSKKIKTSSRISPDLWRILEGEISWKGKIEGLGWGIWMGLTWDMFTQHVALISPRKHYRIVAKDDKRKNTKKGSKNPKKEKRGEHQEHKIWGKNFTSNYCWISEEWLVHALNEFLIHLLGKGKGKRKTAKLLGVDRKSVV